MLKMVTVKMWEVAVYDAKGNKVRWQGFDQAEKAKQDVEKALRETPTDRAVVTEATEYHMAEE